MLFKTSHAPLVLEFFEYNESDSDSSTSESVSHTQQDLEVKFLDNLYYNIP